MAPEVQCRMECAGAPAPTRPPHLLRPACPPAQRLCLCRAGPSTPWASLSQRSAPVPLWGCAWPLWFEMCLQRTQWVPTEATRRLGRGEWKGRAETEQDTHGERSEVRDIYLSHTRGTRPGGAAPSLHLGSRDGARRRGSSSPVPVRPQLLPEAAPECRPPACRVRFGVPRSPGATAGTPGWC